MADPKAPETADRVHVVDQTGKWVCWIKLDDLRAALAEQHQSHIVSEAEKRVLEAMGNAHPRALKNPRTYGEDLIESCDAELARRSGT